MKFNKYLILPLLIVSGANQSAHAAKFNFKDYFFNSSNKSGVFVGVDQSQDVTTYHTNYWYGNLEDSTASINPDTYKTINDDSFTLTFGARFYLPLEKSKLSNLGFGFKGWYSNPNVAFARTYYGTGDTTETINVSSDVQTIGYEGQLYYDFLNFKTSKMNHAIGLTLGAGTETKSYTNYKIVRDNKDNNSFAGITDFNLNSIIYDVSLHYTLANHVRIEVGYKYANYPTNSQQYLNNDFHALSEVTPKKGNYYLSYSLQF